MHMYKEYFMFNAKFNRIICEIVRFQFLKIWVSNGKFKVLHSNEYLLVQNQFYSDICNKTSKNANKPQRQIYIKMNNIYKCISKTISFS